MIQDLLGQSARVGLKGRVAVLVDGENIAQDWTDQIVKRSMALGELVVTRVYGNAGKLPKWDATPGFKLVHSGSGKNATDLLLSIDAVDLSYRGGLDTFVIASSDRDFTHLAHHLRERLFTVVGIGTCQATDTFRRACTRFVELDRLDPKPAENTKVVSKSKATQIDEAIRATIVADGEIGRGISLKILGTRLHTAQNIQKTECGHKTWRAYLESRPDLYVCEPVSDSAYIRLKTS